MGREYKMEKKDPRKFNEWGFEDIPEYLPLINYCFEKAAAIQAKAYCSNDNDKLESFVEKQFPK